MIRRNSIPMISMCAALALVGCSGDDGASDDTAADADETGTDAETETTGDGTETTGDGTDTESTGDTGDTGDTETGEDPFVFDESAPGDYAQVDRMGMPAINTAVITSKDQYNADSPASDAAGDYVTEITENLTGLHAALDDDLTGAGLTPCAVADCVAQAAPLVVPDTLTLDLTMPAAFPNGRTLTDPVMDVTLAVILLDLTAHTAVDLVGTNPTENDVSFQDEFPYLADPN